MQDQHPDSRVILIAERSQSVRDLQSYFLNQAGFTVEFVDDGEAALERALAIRPLLVVTEILIPKIDGLALSRRLQENPATRDIPVLVFSILAAGARASEAGAKLFLRKPLVESVFLSAVQQLIAAHPIGALEEQWASK
ncbi:MAG: response regulator [Gemmatimonadetes bacterium]|nr:response regulator [Gemmatimonadota bacterium]